MARWARVHVVDAEASVGDAMKVVGSTFGDRTSPLALEGGVTMQIDPMARELLVQDVEPSMLASVLEQAGVRCDVASVLGPRMVRP